MDVAELKKIIEKEILKSFIYLQPDILCCNNYCCPVCNNKLSVMNRVGWAFNKNFDDKKEYSYKYVLVLKCNCCYCNCFVLHRLKSLYYFFNNTGFIKTFSYKINEHVSKESKVYQRSLW